jgi:hypothetical protein
MVWRLHRLFNPAPNAFVLLAPAMTLNLITGMGYVNYLVGTFLFLCLAWTMLRFDLLAWRPLAAILVSNALGVLLFLCHIFALGIAGVFLFGLRFGQAPGRPFVERSVRAGLLSAACMAVPLIMALLAPHSGEGFGYSWTAKIRALWAPMLYSSVAAAAALVFLWFALFLWAFGEKQVDFAPVVRWPLLCITLFSLLLPSALLYAVDLDSRSLITVAYLAIPAIVSRSDAGRIPGAQLSAAIVGVATLAVQIGVSLPMVRLYNRQVAEFRAAASVFRPFDRVLTVQKLDAEPPIPNRYYTHLVSWATRDRKIFNPLEFTGKGMQPLVVNPEFACISSPPGGPIGSHIAYQLLDPATDPLLNQKGFRNLRFAFLWQWKFDYLVYYHFGSRGNPYPGVVEPVRQGSFFTVYKIVRPSPLNCGSR